MTFEENIVINREDGGKQEAITEELLLNLNFDKIAEILKNENEYFNFSEIDRFSEIVKAENFFFEYDGGEDGEWGEREAKEFAIKVFRSKKWTPQHSIDKDFKHQVLYYAGVNDVIKEYLPDEIEEKFNEVWEKFKKQYPELSLDDLQKFDDFKRALLLNSSLFEKKVIHFKKPLLIRETNYSKPWECNGVKDLRYIKKEEINKLKKEATMGLFMNNMVGLFVLKNKIFNHNMA